MKGMIKEVHYFKKPYKYVNENTFICMQSMNYFCVDCRNVIFPA